MNMKTVMGIFSGIAATGLVSFAAADTLELRNGNSIDGLLIGATGDSLYVRTEGRVEIVNVDDVALIRFDKRPSPQAGAGSVGTAPRRAVIVAAGTAMMVALPQTLVQGNLINGDQFSATLSEDFKSGDVLVASAGSRVYGQVVSPAPGGLAMVLTELTVAGDRMPIKTQSRSLPLSAAADTRVEFLVERPFTLRLASN